jgi:hypothetical protein
MTAEPAPLESSAPLLERWHDLVHTYTISLIGDYAGNELFLVEGDSLLLHCFQNKTIDFQGMNNFRPTSCLSMKLRDKLPPFIPGFPSRIDISRIILQWI